VKTGTAPANIKVSGTVGVNRDYVTRNSISGARLDKGTAKFEHNRSEEKNILERLSSARN
jgi:hypothetical protein